MIVLAGLALVALGLLVGLAPGLYNGQWLLGLLIAALGLIFIYLGRKGGPRDH